MRNPGWVKRVFSILMIGTVVLFGGLTGMPAFADEVTPKQRIQISPATQDVGELEPGEVYTGSFKVQNTGTERLSYSVFTTPFSVAGDDYQQNFTEATQYTSISEWITFSQDSGEIDPNKQEEITFTISVPKDVPAGGQYASIMVRMENGTESSDDGSGVNMYSQVGMLLFSQVNGTTRKEGKVLENKVPSFMFVPPISATSIVENTGNVHADATYVMQVYGLFGDEEVYTNEEDPEVRTILPETRRLNTMAWEGAPHLGIFRVKQTVKFLDRTSVTEKLVFICPIWFLLIVLAVVFLIIFWIIMHIRGGRE